MVKRYAHLLPFVLLVPASHAQTPFEYADQRTHNTWYTTLTAQDGGWTVGGNAGMENGIYTFGFVTHLSGEGDTAWTVQPGNAEFYNGFPTAATRTPDDHVVIAGMVDGCDVGPFDQGFLMSIAPDGTVDWQRLTFLSSARDLDRASTGHLAALGYDALEIRTATGDSLYRWPAEAERIFWASDTILLLCSDTAAQRISWTGIPLGGAPLPAPVMCTEHTDGKLLVIRADGWLFALDDVSLMTVDSVQLDDTFDRSALLRIGNTWRAVGDSLVFELDAQLTVTGNFPLDPADEFPPGLFHTFASDGSNLIAMTGTPLLANRTTGLVRVMSTDGLSAAHSTDVAIEVASVDSTWYTGTPPIIYPRASISIRVTNEGIETVEDLVLNSWINGGICSAPGNTYRFHELGLAQGEDTVLAAIQPLLWYGPYWSVDSQAFCIAALSPNNLYDRDQSDNLACDTIHIVLGLAEIDAEEPGLRVRDPFSEAIDLTFTTPSKEPLRAILFDVTGRQVATTTIAAGSRSQRWELPDLGDGIHVLRLDGATTSITRKLVHARP